ncbi:MAG TPA: type IV pilin protein [Dyella sp.]|uniref:type IV pilin protein n=1 Tax=Dyella sp. TaxID=1869338 RepID=UPI002F936B70
MRRYRPLKCKQRGFSLIEILVVAALVALLAGMALNGYSNYIHRARRVEAKEALLRIADAQERYFLTYQRYGDFDDLGVASALTAHNIYRLSLSFSDASRRDFTASASPAGTQANDRCGTFSIDYTGAKLPAPNSPAQSDCW